MVFSEDKLKEVQRIISFYPEGKQKSAVIPVLHLAQEEFGSKISTIANLSSIKIATRLMLFFEFFLSHNSLIWLFSMSLESLTGLGC